MEIVVENNVTTKEIKTLAEWHRKQAEKLNRMFLSEFSRAEKDRVENLKEGKASSKLHYIAFKYIQDTIIARSREGQIEYFNTYRPSLETLFRVAKCEDFDTLKPYYNKYFAHWYYKKNWASIVDEFFKD